MMADSRRFAYSIYRKTTSPLRWIFNTSAFTGNLLLAGFLTWAFYEPGMETSVILVFFLLVISVGLWITEAVPPFAVGIFIIVFLVVSLGSDVFLSAPMEVDQYINTWTSSVIWLLLGGFFLAKGMAQVQLDRVLFNFTVSRFGSNPTGLLLGLMLTTGLGSMLMSNTATTAMMMTSIMPLIRKLGKKHPFAKSLLVGIPAAASVGGIGTIIGSTPNAIAVGALSGAGIHINFLQWTTFGVPIALITLWLLWQYLNRVHKLKNVHLDFDFEDARSDDPVNPYQRTITIVTIVLTLGLWLSEPLHGIPVAVTATIPILLLTMNGIIEADEVRQMPWDTLILVAGGLALGTALVDTGLSVVFVDVLLELPVHTYVMIPVFALITVLVSNIMSNTAASAILIPIGIVYSAAFEVSLPLIISTCASCALMLPVSTPPNAIAFSTGYIEQKDFLKSGLFVGAVGLTTSIVILIGYQLLGFL